MNRWPFTVVAVDVALLGGAYFGAFSCSGYAWHKEAFAVLLTIVAIAALLVPLHRQRPVQSRLIVLLGIPTAFVTAQAAAAPFYPALPDSLGGFLRAFMLALESGSC